MNSPSPKRPKWWQLPWKEICSFVLGAAILLHQELMVGSSPQPVLVGAGLALIGIPGAGAVQRAVKKKIGDDR